MLQIDSFFGPDIKSFKRVPVQSDVHRCHVDKDMRRQFAVCMREEALQASQFGGLSSLKMII